MSGQTVYLQLQALFLFAVVWSIGASLPTESRVRFDAYFRDLVSGVDANNPKPKTIKLTKANSFPERQTVYDFWFNKRSAGAWQEWNQLTAPSDTSNPEQPQEAAQNEPANESSDTIVNTVDTARMQFFLKLYTSHEVPSLFVGPTGQSIIYYCEAIF